MQTLQTMTPALYSLPPRLKKAINQESRDRGLSEAAYVRRALRSQLVLDGWPRAQVEFDELHRGPQGRVP